jgi:hypothetical protein
VHRRLCIIKDDMVCAVVPFPPHTSHRSSRACSLALFNRGRRAAGLLSRILRDE